MINYLYYKLYQASLKSSLKAIPQILAPLFLAGLISINFLVINAFLAKLNLLPYLFLNVAYATSFVVILISILLIYFNKTRYEAILQRFSQEDRRRRIIGNIAVGLYVSVSLLSIFAVAFFKPNEFN